MDVLVAENHPTHLLVYLYELYKEQSLCDVRLVSSDGVPFPAHRVVLAASSVYLQGLVLTDKVDGSEELILDVKSDTLRALLDFMYTGQLFVSVAGRSTLLQAACFLKMETAEKLLTTTKTSTEKKLHDMSWKSLLRESPVVVDCSKSFPQANQSQVSSPTADCGSANTAAGGKKHPRKQAPSQVSRRRTRKSAAQIGSPAVPIKKEVEEDFTDIKPPLASNEEKHEASALSEDEVDVGGDDERNDPSFALSSPKSTSKKSSSPKVRRRSKRSTARTSRSMNEVTNNSKTSLDAAVENIKQEKPKKTGRSRKKGSKTSPKKFKKIIIRRTFVPISNIKCHCGVCGHPFKGYSLLKKHMLCKHNSFNVDFCIAQILVKRCLKRSKFKSWERSEVSESSSLQDSEIKQPLTMSLGKVESSHESKSYNCYICSKTFHLYSKFCLHFSRVHSKGKVMHLFSGVSRQLKFKALLISMSSLKQSIPSPKKPKVRNFQCPKCRKMFVSKTTMCVHLKKIHLLHDSDLEMALGPEFRAKHRVKLPKDLQLLCPEANCAKSLSTKQALLKHLQVAHDMTPDTAKEVADELGSTKCEVSGCTFTSRNRLHMKQHMQTYHPDVWHNCTECRQKFRVRCMLDNHMVRHQMQEYLQKYVCEYCGKRFAKGYHLRIHEFAKHSVQHSNVKVYNCEFPGCKYLTTSHTTLRQHSRTHDKEKKFTCDYCGMKLKTAVSHRKHVSKMHLGIRPFLCQVCGQSFGEDHELQAHIKHRHSMEKEFQCEHCPYATANKGTFYTHLFNVHKKKAIDDKREAFRCPHPNCTFQSILHHRFQTHLNGHTNTRNYCCKLCNKFFISSSTLRAHKQWYHSDKVYSCNQCGYQTKTTQKLNEHIRVQHQLKGFKPYKCPYCDFRCATGGNCRKHIKQVHRGQPITYIRDDNLLTAARIARASGQTAPLISLF